MIAYHSPGWLSLKSQGGFPLLCTSYVMMSASKGLVHCTRFKYNFCQSHSVCPLDRTYQHFVDFHFLPISGLEKNNHFIALLNWLIKLIFGTFLGYHFSAKIGKCMKPYRHSWKGPPCGEKMFPLSLSSQIYTVYQKNCSVCCITYHTYIPRTEMTLVLLGKGLVLKGWPSKIEVNWVLGVYIYIYIYLAIFPSIRWGRPRLQCLCL